MCIELIPAEYSGYMAQVGLEAVEHDPSQDLTFELEAARYNNARDLRLDLAARLQHIGTILRNLERCARLGGFPHGRSLPPIAMAQIARGRGFVLTWILQSFTSISIVIPV